MFHSLLFSTFPPFRLLGLHCVFHCGGFEEHVDVSHHILECDLPEFHLFWSTQRKEIKNGIGTIHTIYTYMVGYIHGIRI